MRVKRPKTRVKEANLADNLLSLCPLQYRQYTAGNTTFQVDIVKSHDLTEERKEELMNLLECNMKASYEKTPCGWDRAEKRSEMFDPSSRHVVVTSDDIISAFSHFRFDMDYGVDVVYCYEVQIDPVWQRRGLGRFLMSILEELMFSFSLTKLVLTVFKSNPDAIKFYESLDFRTDDTCPEDTHYLILSKLNANKVATIV